MRRTCGLQKKGFSMNFWKKCPLLMILLASGLCIAIVSAVNRNGVYRDYEKSTFMTPVLAAFFEGIKDGVYPWSEEQTQLASAEPVQEAEAIGEENSAEPKPDQEAEAMPETEAAYPPEEETEAETAPEMENAREPESDPPTEAAPQEQEQQTQPQDGEEEDGLPQEAEENISMENQEQDTANVQPLEGRSFVLGRVEEDYFEDALFIGDSRTQGLYEYGGFGENVTFYCKTSLTVYDLFKKNRAFIKEDGESITLEEALTRHSFGKIYLMIGINEMGTGTAESFFEEYARAVYRIRQLQPNALIFVQAIMNVGEKKNATDPIFNNFNIAVRNVEIATLADNQTIFYIDVNEVLCDENGNLFEGWSNDQIHLKAKYYAVWKEFLLNHGAVEAPAS